MKHTVKYRPSSKVIAAKAPYQVNELVKEIQDTVYNVASKYLKAEGWDMSDIADYFVVDVSEAEPGVIRAEIRGELDYEELSDLCSQLDKVIAVKFDKDAYFEPVEPGIAETFIRTNVEACSNVTASTDNVTLKDIKSAIDSFGHKYFDSFISSDNSQVWMTVFDAGSYGITTDGSSITMIPTDDPDEGVRTFNSLGQFKGFLGRLYEGRVQSYDDGYSINATSSNAKMRKGYITHYGDFDNGHVWHDSKRMTEEEAQEAAKQASIKDPTTAYYVYYTDSIMNDTTGIVWVNGVAYRGRDVNPRGEGVIIEEGAQPIEMSTEIKAYTFDESEDGWGEDVEDILSTVFARAEDMMYEIRNTVRGVNTHCETTEDLADFIREMASEFEDAADEIESL